MDDRFLRASNSDYLTDVGYVMHWLVRFEQALCERNGTGLRGLFLEESHWRDLLSFTWNITPLDGAGVIAGRLGKEQLQARARNFSLIENGAPPRRVQRVGIEVIEAIFQFETDVGRCRGVVRLKTDEPTQAWALMTSLRELKGHEERLGSRQPSGAAYSREFGGANWMDRRAKERAFADREPAVLIIGAGQSGLATAARLRLLGVDCLCVDRHPRVGDAWRRRYHALALHNQMALNHMPYLPFPGNWPKYLAKDMVANWLETYAEALECNVWTSATLESATYDESTALWHARVRRADGSERVLRPRHLVFANGVAGEPKIPQLPGLEEFNGEVSHTHWYRDGSAWKGKNVLVLGAGNSGHDVAQDLYSYGANVKLIQRGSIMVLNVKTAGLSASLYYDEGLSTDDCDLIASTNTFSLIKRGYQLVTKRQLEADRELLAGLAARGFKLDSGPDGAGFQMKTREKHGGYYLNCGCSDLIVEGKIGLLPFDEIERFVPEGVLKKSGEVERAELVVMATGYQSQQEVIRRLLGERIASKVGAVWGIDVDGELTNMYRPTPQRGLWFMGGGLAHARINSHYVALQIKAREVGIIKN